LSKLAARGSSSEPNISVEEDVADMVPKTVETFGKLDFAFNNAGILLESAPITSVALEFASLGVRVNAVCPGVIETPMNEADRKDAKGNDFLNAMQPVGRIGRAEEVAAAVLYLRSPNASFTTGTTLSVDSGIGI